MRRIVTICVLPLAFAATLIPAATRGEDFRIQTKVFKEEEKEPVSQNTTIFRAGQVFDFLSEPAEITIFDRPRGDRLGQFVLLDPQRQLQTEVPLALVQETMQKISGWAAGRDDTMLNFLARPQFTEKTNDKGVCTFTSPYLTYQVKATPAPTADVFQQYDEFSDWFVRLNTMLSVRSRPPYGMARLAVNVSLRARKEIPSEVTLVVSSGRLIKKQVTYRSEHQFTTLLPQSDLARIDKSGTYRATFKKVSFEVYSSAPPETASNK